MKNIFTILSCIIYLNCSKNHVITISAYSDSTMNGDVDSTSSSSLIQSSSSLSTRKRKTSIWSSFMNFVHCHPGPLGGNNCNGSSSGGSSSSGSSNNGSSSSGSSNNGSSSSGSNSGSSSSGSSSSGSSSSGSSSSGSSSSGNSSSGNSSSGSSSSGSSSSGSSSSGSSSSGNSSGNSSGSSSGGDADSPSRMADISSRFLSWAFVVGGLVALSSGIAMVVHKSSQTDPNRGEGGFIGPAGQKASGNHALQGSVRKRLSAFSSAYYSKFGNERSQPMLSENDRSRDETAHIA